MRIKRKQIHSKGVRISINEGGKEIAHAYLYIMQNDRHEEPFGLIENIFVEEASRSKGHGTELLEKLIKEAQKGGCYKIIATSRHARETVHRWYEKLGFEDYGVEFRLNLSP